MGVKGQNCSLYKAAQLTCKLVAFRERSQTSAIFIFSLCGCALYAVFLAFLHSQEVAKVLLELKRCQSSVGYLIPSLTLFHTGE